jgi:hypothetical protein
VKSNGLGQINQSLNHLRQEQLQGDLKQFRKRVVEETTNPYTMRKGGGKKNQCKKCKKYGHNTRTCTLKKRHDEIQERRRSFYREHAAATECNLDMVSCAFLPIFNCLVK